MGTLIFDIETVGESWETFDETTKQVLTRWIDKTSKDNQEKESLINDLKDGLGFSPLTGFIVAIGVYDLERERGVVYYTGLENEADRFSENFTFKQRSEKAMLAEFWEGAKSYDTFVTFNGRTFDAPFLFHRSLAHGITPTRNLLEGRYPNQQRSVRHVDLQDELTFFGAMNRRPSLHLFCRTYGITSPKQEVSGDDVATTTLYKTWLKHTVYSQTEQEIDF